MDKIFKQKCVRTSIPRHHRIDKHLIAATARVRIYWVTYVFIITGWWFNRAVQENKDNGGNESCLQSLSSLLENFIAFRLILRLRRKVAI